MRQTRWANRRTALLLLFVTLWCLVAPGRATWAAPARHALVGHWEGPASRDGDRWRIALDVWLGESQLRGTLDAVDAGLYAWPLDKIELREDGACRLACGRQRSRVTINARLEGDRIVGTLEGFGLTGDLSVSRTAATPSRLVEEAVRFTSGRVTLVGTLVRPPTPGPHPVIVWTHGSGYIDRNSDSYRRFGYMLARHGVAALLYDKRGVGESTGTFRDATLDDLAGDALAGVELLKRRDDIDPSRIGMGGHSQGGWITPLAAVRSPDIAFAIVIAAAGMSPAIQANFLIENKLRDDGVEDDLIARIGALHRRVDAFLRTGDGAGDVERALMAVRREPWYRASSLPRGSLASYRDRVPAWLSFDPIPLWEQIDVPVLAFWGEADKIVPPRRSYELIKSALDRGGNDRSTPVLFPGADHDLLIVAPGDAERDWPRIAPGAEEQVIRWADRYILTDR